MKKALLFLLALIVFQQPSWSANKKMIPTTDGKNIVPHIFIYSIPESDKIQEKEETDAPEEAYIEATQQEEPEISFEIDDEEEYDSSPLYATVLKGYAEYVEDSASIHLKDDEDNFVLNIKVPQKISASQGLNLGKSLEKKPYLQYKNAEYAIAPSSIKASGKTGDFTIGALYGNEVDNIAMLEKETGLFTKYEKERFALSTTYKKNLNTTYSSSYDTISIAPELKLNSYMSLKNEYKADITRNRRSGAVIFSLNPFGKKDFDRLRLEVGAKQTVYLDTDFTKTEFNFSTQFKL